MFGRAICPSAFLKIFKNHEADLSPKSPEPNMWLFTGLITLNQQTLCIESKFVSFTSTRYQTMSQFQGKQMIQSQENVEKPHFGPNFEHLGPN